MASIKDLKKRIGTVKNTQQTTRAMKVVSAAKLRRAQEAIQNQRPYAKKISQLIQEVSAVADLSSEQPLANLVMKRRGVGAPSDEKKTTLLVVVTSDRGLCGGFNSNAIKACQKWLNAHPEKLGQVELAFVGRKGYDFFKTRKTKVKSYFQELGGKVSFAKAKKLADALTEAYLKDEVDEVKFIYSEFKNAATQKIVVEDFLPLPSFVFEKESQELKVSIVKPGQPEVLQELLTKNFAIQAFRILLESQAGEHGARMSSMENATKNAGEMIRKLTLQYNKQRQAGITKELLEIISGSESQKG